MAEAEVDLAKLFGTVTRDLKGNQAALNQADAYNHNHGDNMVKNFKAITKALKEKPGAPPSEQLSYASQALLQGSPSGSAQLYAQGLTQAAEQLQGQPRVNDKNALSLVQALLGSQPTAQPSQDASGDMMSQLLGSMLGGQQTSQAPQDASGDMMGQLLGSMLGGQQTSHAPQDASADMMSQLLGSMMGGQQTSQAPQDASGDMMSQLLGSMLGGGAAPQPAASQPGGGFDLNTLLTAGMTYLQASQQGAAPMDALVQAVMAGSQMNDAPHHSQSGQLVAGSLISALGSMLGSKKRR